MTAAKIQAIKKFYESVESLKKLNVIRSDVIFGDIGEFLCSVVHEGLLLEDKKTNPGFDATLGGKTVQIKHSDSSAAENIDLGNPKKYDMLIVVLGKNSAHRMANDADADYLFYSFSSSEVQERFKIPSGGYKLSRTKHFRPSDKKFSMPV
ncbi:MAG: hypothetical protein PHP85_11520 [Gallionella sp.]|nr:hypothetical protein [Gallionella sp.]